MGSGKGAKGNSLANRLSASICAAVGHGEVALGSEVFPQEVFALDLLLGFAQTCKTWR